MSKGKLLLFSANISCVRWSCIIILDIMTLSPYSKNTFRAGFGNMSPELMKGYWVFLSLKKDPFTRKYIGHPGGRQVKYGKTKSKQIHKAAKGT